MLKKLFASLALGASLLTGMPVEAAPNADCYLTQGDWKVCYRNIGGSYSQDYIMSVSRPGDYWPDVFRIRCDRGSWVDSEYYSDLSQGMRESFSKSFCYDVYFN